MNACLGKIMIACFDKYVTGQMPATGKPIPAMGSHSVLNSITNINPDSMRLANDMAEANGVRMSTPRTTERHTGARRGSGHDHDDEGRAHARATGNAPRPRLGTRQTTLDHLLAQQLLFEHCQENVHVLAHPNTGAYNNPNRRT